MLQDAKAVGVVGVGVVGVGVDSVVVLGTESRAKE